MAKVLAAQERFEEAATLVRGYLDSEKPTAPEPWVFLGRLLLDQRDPSVLGDASSAFTQAQYSYLTLSPRNWGNIEVQTRLGNEGVAIAMCDRYLSERTTGSTTLTEQDAQIYFQRAILRSNHSSGQSAALVDLDSAISIVEAPRFLSLRAFLRRVTGDAAGAIVDLRRVSDLSGTLSISDEVTMAEAYIDTGGFEDAAHYIRSAYEQRGKRVTGNCGTDRSSSRKIGE